MSSAGSHSANLGSRRSSKSSRARSNPRTAKRSSRSRPANPGVAWATATAAAGVALLPSGAGAAAVGSIPTVASPLWQPANGAGLRVAAGFTLTRYANPSLAGNVRTMAINPRGQVVISGPGFIRTLVDGDGDGVADRAIDFGETETGAQAMSFDGTDLLFAGDEGLWRVRDVNGDNQADGDALRLIELPPGEHGARGLRRGPDGSFGLLLGDSARLESTPGPLGPRGDRPGQGGALLRVSLGDSIGFQVVAHGFHRPSSFDHNADGDVFIGDAGPAEAHPLPWHLPTVLFQVQSGGHHGWRGTGDERSWPLPLGSPDAVEPLALLPGQPPADLVCYRHRQFPELWQGGLFLADPQGQRVTFVGLEADDARHMAELSTFLEASPASRPFQPTALAVAPDGSLLVGAAGSGPAAGLWRIQHAADPAALLLATNWIQLAGADLLAALDAPQPQEAWSRQLWQPLAERAGRDAFLAAATDTRLSVARRIRAIEILTDLGQGLPNGPALACAMDTAAEVRARTAWSVGARPPANAPTVLEGLARDSSAHVRRCALDAMRLQASRLPGPTLANAVSVNLDHADRDVRQSAARLATWLPSSDWSLLSAQQRTAPTTARITWLLAEQWRQPAITPGGDTNRIDATLNLLGQARTLEDQSDLLRLLVQALGEQAKAPPGQPLPEALVPVTPSSSVRFQVATIERALTPLVASKDSFIATEATRGLALIGAKDSRLPSQVLTRITTTSAPAEDVHCLAVLTRLAVAPPTNTADRVAAALVGLDRKLAERGISPGSHWTPRVVEIARQLADRQPAIVPALLRQPELVRPANLPLTSLLTAPLRTPAARLYLAAVNRTAGYPWTNQLIDLLSVLPPAEVHPLLRRHWTDPGLRDRIARELAAAPMPGERHHFAACLASPDPAVVRAASGALIRLPRDPSTLVPALRALQQALTRTGDRELRGGLLNLVNHVTGQRFTAREDVLEPSVAYDHVFAWAYRTYPGLRSQLE